MIRGALVTFGFLLAPPGPSAAGPEPRAPLDAGADSGIEETREVEPNDPWERGASTIPAARPAPMPLRACSFRWPACVQGARGQERAVMDALHVTESAFAIVTGALRLPAPDADVMTHALDVYLVDRDDDDATVRRAGRDLLASFDRAYTFIEMPARATGCAREVMLTRAILEATLARVAPATSEGLALATTAHLAGLACPCAHGMPEDVALFQSRPTRGLFDADTLADPVFARGRARGAGIFFDWVDTRFGVEPGGLVRASWSLAPTITSRRAETYTSKPDLLDVFRTSFKDVLSVRTTMDDLFLRFASARASFGPFADESTLPAARARGEAARVAVDFSVDWPNDPRRFLSPVPVAPLGAAYIAVSRKGAPAGTRLRIEADWEEHARFRFAAIKLDARGAPKATVLIPSTPKSTSAQATITELDDTATVLIAAMNGGDYARAYDPDDGTWEPHAFLLTLASE